jgi:Flp pilus assembly protein TadG
MAAFHPELLGRASARAPQARDTRARGRRRARGQSLAEFALTVPMALLMILFGLDFGRVFLGWVALNNATREAANYAALNPKAWSTELNLAVQAEYARLVTTETSNINCTLTSVAAPQFPSGTGIGSPAVVAFQCRFQLVTPVISRLLGNPVTVSASSAFPIRSGAIEGVPVATTLPSRTPAPTPTPAPTATPTAAPTATPTAAPTATPIPTSTCRVPNFRNKTTSEAVGLWTNAGFAAGNILFSPLVPPHYTIRDQSLSQNAVAPCSSTITVTGR